MGDMVGRKWGIVVSCMVFSLGIGLQLDTQWSAFIVGRFIAGVGVVCRTVCCTLCNSHLFLGARFMFSPHVSIRGIKINDITFYVYLTFDCQNLIVRPQKFTWSHCRTLPVCESVEGVILFPHHFVDVFFLSFYFEKQFLLELCYQLSCWILPKIVPIIRHGEYVVFRFLSHAKRYYSGSSYICCINHVDWSLSIKALTLISLLRFPSPSSSHGPLSYVVEWCVFFFS